MKNKTEKKALRCAIYTRKSVAEGLEQEFNSLDAQRESAEAYIASQKQEGWSCLDQHYDDGGFSGGNLERPAMRQLLADVEAGKIDVVVVYKVDRLSRSLLDFARIMEVLDKHGVSFVSVTQQFNTTSSMGRLTLNILLSFAQFEREIISERTRDKMGAARKKGKWVGGRPFLGYDIAPEGRALVVNETEAERVRGIFGLYLDHQSIKNTAEELNNRGWTLKQWTTQKGKLHGGGRFTKSSLHGLLTNVAYIGKVNYQGHVADAEFPAIVSKEVFEAAQKCLMENSRTSGARVRNRYSALLRGILRCGHCDRSMVHSYTKKKNRIYRYYVCNHAMKEGWDKCPAPSLPADEIEKFVLEEIARIGSDEKLQAETLKQHEAIQREELANLKRSRKAMEKQLLTLQDQLCKAVASGETDRLAELRQQEDATTAALTENTAKQQLASEPALSAEEFRVTLQQFTGAWDAMTQSERMRLLSLLIEKVSYEGKTGEVAISFRASDIPTIDELLKP